MPFYTDEKVPFPPNRTSGCFKEWRLPDGYIHVKQGDAIAVIEVSGDEYLIQATCSVSISKKYLQNGELITEDSWLLRWERDGEVQVPPNVLYVRKI